MSNTNQPPILDNSQPDFKYIFGQEVTKDNFASFLVDNFRISTGKIEIQYLYIKWLLDKGLFELSLLDDFRQHYGLSPSYEAYSEDTLMGGEITGDTERHQLMLERG